MDGTTWILGGDIIVEADGARLSTFDELRELIEEKDPGDELTFVINRDGDERTVTVTLGRRPASPQG